MATALDNVRVEVAFSADPNTTTPAFVDLTSRARLDGGIEIIRGRQDEFAEVQPGTCPLTFDNTDGALTPGLATSPYYPNVKPQNRIRVTYREPSAMGNLLSNTDAAFEDGTVGTWSGLSGAVPTNSTTHPASGTRGMLITWPTAAANGSGVTTNYGAGQLVIGRAYTVRARIWNAVGSPPVRIGFSQLFTGFYGSQSTTTGAFETISSTFTAVSSTLQLFIRPNSASTSGQQVWVDEIRVDEASAPTGFGGVVANPISYRFDGYVEEWPTAWPTGGQSESTVSITALDLQSRISRRPDLDSVIAETVKLSTPLVYFPLGEPADATSAGDRMGSSSTVAPTQLGTGGELVFADGTGPGTDGAGAPAFRPASASNGLYLFGKVSQLPGYFRTAAVVETTFRTSITTRAMTVARWSDAWGFALAVEIDATGHAVATYSNPWNSALSLTVTSATVFANNRTNDATAELTNTGGTFELRLFVNGVERGTMASSTVTGNGMHGFDRFYIGGFYNDLFEGTIAHVAGIDHTITSGQRSDRYSAVSTGFAGERSDQRIARIASWLGIPAGLQALDVGDSTVGHLDCNGLNAWDYMQKIATTEAGLLFIGTTGLLTFYRRSRNYLAAATVDVSVTADLIDPSTRIVNNLADVVNDVTVSRSGGATVRAVDAASVATYGQLSDSLEVISATDSAAFDRAYWVLALRSQPASRLPELGLDGLTDSTTSPSVRTLDLSSRVQVTSMPSQSPTSTFDLRVQGYRESIGADGWDVTVNASPFLPVRPLILDDPVYGLLDGTNWLVI